MSVQLCEAQRPSCSTDSVGTGDTRLGWNVGATRLGWNVRGYEAEDGMLGATRLGMECLLTLTLSLTVTHSNAKHSLLTLRMVAPIPIVSVNVPDFSA